MCLLIKCLWLETCHQNLTSKENDNWQKQFRFDMNWHRIFLRKYSSAYKNFADFPSYHLVDMLNHTEPVYCGRGFLENQPRPGTHTHTPRDPSNKRAYCMCFLPLQALSRRIHVPDGLALRMLNQQWDREERGGHICFVHVWMYLGLFKHICELLYFTETTDGNT